MPRCHDGRMPDPFTRPVQDRSPTNVLIQRSVYKARDAVENLVRGLGPHKRTRRRVAQVDGLSNGVAERPRTPMDASFDLLACQLDEPAFH